MKQEAQIYFNNEMYPQRLGATAFVLLMLEGCGRMKLNEEIFHSLGYLIQTQMPKVCYPRMRWEIQANYLFSIEIDRGLRLARKQGLITPAPAVALTDIGMKHCSLLNGAAKHCRAELTQAAVATIGLSRNHLHNLCIAAAALASGIAERVTDPDVREVLRRHNQYVTQTESIS